MLDAIMTEQVQNLKYANYEFIVSYLKFHTYIHTYIERIVIVIENGHDDMSSNPRQVCLHFI